MKKKIKIPNLDPLYAQVLALVKENQGEDGFINTSPELCQDEIYALVWDDDYTLAVERPVHAVRVAEEKLSDGKPSEEIEVRIDENGNGYPGAWRSLRWEDVYLIHTLFSIAENICAYI